MRLNWHERRFVAGDWLGLFLLALAIVFASAWHHGKPVACLLFACAFACAVRLTAIPWHVWLRCLVLIEQHARCAYGQVRNDARPINASTRKRHAADTEQQAQKVFASNHLSSFLGANPS